MEANNAIALYGVIFETIAALKNKENPMDLARAKAISGAVQTAVNLATEKELFYQPKQGRKYQ